MNKLTIVLTKEQVQSALQSTAKNLICSDNQYIKSPTVKILDDGSAEVSGELATVRRYTDER